MAFHFRCNRIMELDLIEITAFHYYKSKLAEDSQTLEISGLVLITEASTHLDYYSKLS